MNHLKGEALNVGFDGGIKLEFNGAKVIPLGGNGGLHFLNKRWIGVSSHPILREKHLNKKETDNII